MNREKKINFCRRALGWGKIFLSAFVVVFGVISSSRQSLAESSQKSLIAQNNVDSDLNLEDEFSTENSATTVPKEAPQQENLSPAESPQASSPEPALDEDLDTPTKKSESKSIELKAETPAANPEENLESQLNDDPKPGTTPSVVEDMTQDEAFPLVVEAEPMVEVIESGSDLVEVRYPKLIDTPYREKRETHGWTFFVGTENLFFSDYQSILDDKYYEDLFSDDDVALLQGELGYKFNFTLGALGLSASYGMGSIEDNRSGDTRSLEIAKTSLKLTYFMDNLMEEPYVVPYASAAVSRFDFTEKATSADLDDVHGTDPGFSYTLGVLLQLNWLDRKSAFEGFQSYGLLNTYLDVFVTQYTATQGDDDPDTTSDFNWGAGLRLEF